MNPPDEQDEAAFRARMRAVIQENLEDQAEPAPAPKPLGNTALKAYLAILCKGGGSGYALLPEGGWPGYAGMKGRTFWGAVTRLIDAGLIGWDGRGTYHAPDVGEVDSIIEGGGSAPGIKIAGGAIHALRPRELRAYVVRCAFADWDMADSSHRGRVPGRGLATNATLRRSCGMSEGSFRESTVTLRSSGWLKRERDRTRASRWSRTWFVVVRAGNGAPGKAGQFAWIGKPVLDRHFGFRFAPTAQHGAQRSCAGTTPDVRGYDIRSCAGTTPDVRGYDTVPSTLPESFPSPSGSAPSAAEPPTADIHLVLIPDSRKKEKRSELVESLAEGKAKAERERRAKEEARRERGAARVAEALANAESADTEADRMAWEAEAACRQQRSNAHA